MVQEILLGLQEPQHSGRPITMKSKTMFQAIVANLMSSFQRVSGEHSISQFSMVHHLHNFNKSIQSYQISKILQNFWLILVANNISSKI